MQPSQLVTSLETSQKIDSFHRKIGTYHSFFCWVIIEWKEYIVTEEEAQESDEMEYLFPAFTSAELWEMLPYRIRKNWFAYDLEFWKSHDKSFGTCYIDTESDPKFLISFEDKNEAEARWKLLIYLKENNLV